MKEFLSCIEITVILRELKDLIGSRVEGIYNPNNEIILKLYKKEKFLLRINVPNFLCLTEYRIKTPKFPSNFCMFLRKYLMNSRLIEIYQPELERVVKFKFKKGDNFYFLICEFFSNGNVIICDSKENILIPLKIEKWKDRKIKPKEKYVLPPRIKFEDLDFKKFKKLIAKKSQIVKSIAIDLGIGGTYAEELCRISNIGKNKSPKDINETKLRLLFKNFLTLIEKAKEGKIEANVIYSNGELIDVQPFQLSIYSNYKKTIFKSFNEAVDFYFAKHIPSKMAVKEKEELEKEIVKQKIILEKHKEYLNELIEKAKIYREQADFLYQHLNELNKTIKKILELRKEIGWDGVKEFLKKDEYIDKIMPNEGILILRNGIKINFRNDITENANVLYEKAKKFESKIPGVKRTIKEIEEKIKNLKRVEVKEDVPRKVIKMKKEWYEKFHWFYTTNGKLVISGRDATQNEILIKKYLEVNDIVLHADVYGSPFTIIKNGKDSSDDEKREAAIFTLVHSKAWQNKRIESVYWVFPNQVSKKAPSGEYIGRGAFMIYGKKNYIKDIELRLCVGVQIKPFKIISGPFENIRKKADYFVTLIPGDKNKDLIAKEIKDFLINISRPEHKDILKKIELEEIKSHVPEGCDIKWK